MKAIGLTPVYGERQTETEWPALLCLTRPSAASLQTNQTLYSLKDLPNDCDGVTTANYYTKENHGMGCVLKMKVTYGVAMLHI